MGILVQFNRQFVCLSQTVSSPHLFIYFFKFYFIFKLYIIVLVLPNIKMNPPQVYMCSPSWTLLPPHTIPLGHPSTPAPSIQYRALNLDWQLVSYMILHLLTFINFSFSSVGFLRNKFKLKKNKMLLWRICGKNIC